MLASTNCYARYFLAIRDAFLLKLLDVMGVFGV